MNRTTGRPDPNGVRFTLPTLVLARCRPHSLARIRTWDSDVNSVVLYH